jgi:K+-sensing histidine kinase KdpD
MPDSSTSRFILPPVGARRAVTSYALSIAALVVAVLLRLVLDRWMGDSLPLVTLFGAVAAAGWLGGHRPALIVAIIGYLVCSYLFIEPRGRLDFSGSVIQIGFLAYLFTCALIIAFGEALRYSHAALATP